MKKTTFIISLITTLTMIFTMAVPVRAFSWGTSAGLDAFEDMKQVDDEGTICSGSGYSLFLTKKGELVKVGHVVNCLMAVYKKGVNENTALEETAKVLEKIYSAKTDTSDGVYKIGDFGINSYTVDDTAVVRLVTDNSKLATKDTAEKIMTALAEKELITAFYDWDNIYHYEYIYGSLNTFNYNEADNIDTAAVQKYLDENFGKWNLRFSKGEITNGGVPETGWIVSSADGSEVSYEVYFDVYVALNKEFGLATTWDIPDSAEGSWVVGDNMLESYKADKPSVTVKNGDVNSDNAVDSKDATALLIKYAEALNEDKTLRAEDMPGGDYNGDGKVDSLDATAILIAYAEWLIER